MIDATGYTPTTAATVIDKVNAIFIETFGEGFIIAPPSLNGQLIQIITENALQVEAAKTLLYGGLYNPDIANDVWLKSLCKFNDIKAKPATPSIVNCVVTGLPGTIIPINKQVLNTNGDVFYNPSVIVIPESGVTTILFKSLVLAPINCNAGTVNRIVQTLPGWDSVNNPSDGILGTNEQSNYALRSNRKYSLAINSAGGVDSVISALNENENIINFGVQENPLDLPQVIQGVTINPHCIYVSIYTTYTDEIKNQIANILYSKRYCTMQGDTTWSITDAKYNYITFEARWQTAIVTPVQVNISIQDSPTYPANIIDLIKAAILDNWNGDFIGIEKYRMQDVINISRFYPSLIALNVYQINSITIQLVTSGTPATSISVSLDKVMTLSINNINVTKTVMSKTDTEDE